MNDQPPLEELLERTRRVSRQQTMEADEPLGSVLADRILAERNEDPESVSPMRTVERWSMAGAACAVGIALASSLMAPNAEEAVVGDLWVEI